MPLPPNSCVEILNPNVMILGGGIYEGWLGHECEAIINKIRSLI